MQETPTLSQYALSLASHALAGILAALGTLWFKRKREPAEVRKIDAETRSIDTASDLSVVQEMRKILQEAAHSTARADRVVEEREHWKRKAGDQIRTIQERDADIAALHAAAAITDKEMRELQATLIAIRAQLPPMN